MFDITSPCSWIDVSITCFSNSSESKEAIIVFSFLLKFISCLLHLEQGSDSKTISYPFFTISKSDLSEVNFNQFS